MQQIEITLSANAGVSICIGGYRVWVDALHESNAPGFSTLDRSLQGKMLKHSAFSEPDCICFTHCHGDHFSQGLTEAAHSLWPDAQVFLPEQRLSFQQTVRGREYRYEKGALSLRFLQLPHEGAQYADVAHYGLIVSAAGCNIFLTGDCAVADESLADRVGDTHIDLAVVDFPWITLQKGRAFLDKYFKDTALAVCHLPFEQDDANGYRMSARRAERQLGRKTVLLMDPLQTECIKI